MDADYACGKREQHVSPLEACELQARGAQVLPARVRIGREKPLGYIQGTQVCGQFREYLRKPRNNLVTFELKPWQALLAVIVNSVQTAFAQSLADTAGINLEIFRSPRSIARAGRCALLASSAQSRGLQIEGRLPR